MKEDLTKLMAKLAVDGVDDEEPRAKGSEGTWVRQTITIFGSLTLIICDVPICTIF